MNVNGDHDVIHRTTCRLWSFALLECSDTDRSLHPSVREDCSSSTTQGNEKRLSTSQHIHVYIGFLSWKSMQSGLSGATRARAPAVGGTHYKQVCSEASPTGVHTTGEWSNQANIRLEKVLRVWPSTSWCSPPKHAHPLWGSPGLCHFGKLYFTCNYWLQRNLQQNEGRTAKYMYIPLSDLPKCTCLKKKHSRSRMYMYM